MDFVTDQLADGRRFRVLNVVDDWSRECVLQVVDFSISGERVARALEELSGSRQLPRRIVCDNGTEFCGVAGHPYETYLELNDIEHRRTKVRSPQTNGFVERFNRTVLEGFFRVKFRERFYGSVEALQEDLDAWLAFYNRERPHLGYWNQGRTPYETVLLFANQSVRQEG